MTNQVRGCVSADTEVLTSTGFKLFSELSQTDKLAQFDPHDNNAITFATPTDIRSGQVKGTLSHVHKKAGSLDLLCTPDLGVVQKYSNPETNKHRIQTVPAANLKKGVYYYLPMAGHGAGAHADITLKERFLIATQADGTVRDRYSSECPHKVVQMTMLKERKIVRLESMLDKLEYKYHKAPSSTHKGSFAYGINVPKEDKPTKRFLDWPPPFESIPSNWASDFILEAVEWDGHWNKNADGTLRGSIHYSCTVKENADTLAIIASLCGWRPLVRCVPDNRKESYKDVYRVHLLPNHEWVRTGTLLRTKQEYDGMVYGASTPKETLIIRRNGAIAFIGSNPVNT